MIKGFVLAYISSDVEILSDVVSGIEKMNVSVCLDNPVLPDMEVICTFKNHIVGNGRFLVFSDFWIEMDSLTLLCCDDFQD